MSLRMRGPLATIADTMTADVLPCLAARQVSKAYGATRALDAVDFTVARGEIHALLGENGAGKSTLVKILSGIVKPDAGVIELEGEAIEPSPKLSSRRGIVVVHQELSLLPNLSQPNVILHVMDDSLWRNIKELDHIPPAAAASDLIEVGFLLDSDRWQRAGWDLLERSWPKQAA